MKQSPPKALLASPSMTSPQQQARHHGRSNKMYSSLQQNTYFLTICITAAITWSIAGLVVQMQNCTTDADRTTLYQGNTGGVSNRQPLVREEWNSSSSIATAPSNVHNVHHSSSKEAESPKMTTSTATATATTTTTTAVQQPYNGPSRVWEKAKNGFPCHRGNGEKRLMITTPASEGMLFQRPTKVGSTTMVGIVLRLVHNRSPWAATENVKCSHRSMHGTARSLDYIHRNREKSFLFGLIREPTKRAISQFFHFNVAAYQVVPTDDNLIRFLKSRNLRNVYMEEMTLRNYTKTFGPAVNHTAAVEEILDGYDFIAVTEKMDESLVVMQMLLNLTTKEILYTKARSSGTFSNGFKDRPCIYIIPSFLTTGVKQFLASDYWKEATRADLLLHRAASASLDRTIAALNQDGEFDRNMAALKKGLARVEDACSGKVTTLCTEAGVRIDPKNTTCYIWSEGCDHDCIDSIPDL